MRFIVGNRVQYLIDLILSESVRLGFDVNKFRNEGFSLFFSIEWLEFKRRISVSMFSDNGFSFIECGSEFEFKTV